MNKIIAILFVMMFAVAGCGDSSSSGERVNELCQYHQGVKQIDGDSNVVVCNDGTAVSW